MDLTNISWSDVQPYVTTIGGAIAGAVSALFGKGALDKRKHDDDHWKGIADGWQSRVVYLEGALESAEKEIEELREKIAQIMRELGHAAPTPRMTPVPRGGQGVPKQKHK